MHEEAQHLAQQALAVLGRQAAQEGALLPCILQHGILAHQGLRAASSCTPPHGRCLAALVLILVQYEDVLVQYIHVLVQEPTC